MDQIVVGFAGLTHLGLNSAVASASKRFKTIGYHEDKEIVENLKNGKTQIDEPDLEKFLKENSNRLEFGSNVNILNQCDIVYISVDVPTDDNGKSDLSPINQIIQSVSTILKKEAILVVLCQVPPGFTRSIKNKQNAIFYQVETLIFGRAIERALYPERFIIGCSQSNMELPSVYKKFLESFSCPILKMKYESAELAKISINMFLVSSVTTTNTIAEVCEKIGADWSEIVPTLRMDKRIGQYAYLTPGLGISGGNLERDLATILSYSEVYETDKDVVSSWQKNSKNRKNWVYDRLHELIKHTKNITKIGVLGLTYKEDTHSLKNSPSIAFLEKAKSMNLKILAYDPKAAENATREPVVRVQNLEEAIFDVEVLLILTPWAEFKNLTLNQLLNKMKDRIIIDPYGVLSKLSLPKFGFIYVTLGKPIEFPDA